MKRILIPVLPTDEKGLVIPEDEAHHLIQVLRARNGDEVECLDGKGSFCRGRVEFTGKGSARILPLSKPESNPKLFSVPLRLEMAILKGDAMEWVIEKAVEIGVRDFVPLETAHCVVQLDKKGPAAFRERWQKIADQALKQCGRLDRMKVFDPIPFQDVTKTPSTRFFLDESSRANTPNLIEALSKDPKRLVTEGVSIVVGPEGGWNDAERRYISQSSIPSVSLGPWVLRAETAALFAASLIVGSMR